MEIINITWADFHSLFYLHNGCFEPNIQLISAGGTGGNSTMNPITGDQIKSYLYKIK